MNIHMKKELSGEIYEQMSLGSKRNHEEVDGSRTNKPANKLIKLHDNDGKGMEGDVGVSMRVNNFAGVMSKDDAFGRRETAAAEMEGGKLKKIPGCVLCPICHLKIRSVSELNNHQQTCIRRTSNTVRPKKKEHDSESSDEESEHGDDENVATCQGCEMSFASDAGLDAHRQHCNKKVRCDVIKPRGEGEGEMEGNNNFQQGVCEDSKPPLEVSYSLMSTKSEVLKKLDVVRSNIVQCTVNNTCELAER